ncbi:transcriptional regulator family: Fungal Specific TF [Paecilomyces variotii]|nr:transcriptional regulator family: Fungal Specific TF [Paecilomyces variotii]
MASTGPREVRERRTPRRSRYGCRNCKLRKLKCDEGKPHCKRCSSFGVLCNFMSNIPDLQPIADGTGRRPLVVRGKAELQHPVANAVWTSDESTFYQLNAKCQDFITRYLGRSLMTPDDPNMIHVNRKLLRLSFTYPYLMHASLAVALTYDRHLNSSLGCRRSLEECYHWSQSTTLLNRRLREPIEAKDKDPIWGTAAALVILSFSSPDACTPEESWPLNSSDHSHLDWLRMSKGKMSLWHIVNPLRPDSLFHVMAATFAQMHSPLPESGIDGIPRALATTCLLKESSTAKNNPYFHAAHAVSQLLALADSEVTTGQTQFFMRSIHGPFENLLRTRDPVALLLLYLWYRKASRSIWWIELRARVECPSICSYLRLYHKGNVAVQAFLPGGALADEWG